MKNQTNYELGNNLTEFINVEITSSEVIKDGYNRLKDEIFKLDLDVEEKANIINKINSLNTMKTEKEKKKIIKEIEEFKKEYDI